MFSHFFINRPIFASVVSLIIMIAGAVTYTKLPVAQFPDIVPPVVCVSANYPGADAQTLIETVATPIEQQINGVDNMIYMSSTCGSDGTYSLNVYFEVGSDPDMSTVLVQNRVSLAEPSLPEDVTRLGVSVQKQSTNMLGFYCLREIIQKDEKGNELPPTKSDLYLSNYASIFVKDQLARVHGVGKASIMDAKDFSMRVWLNPDIMSQRDISVQEVIAIIKEQNVQVASGSMGAEPVPEGQVNTLTITTQGRLSNVEEFENLVVRTDDDGSILKLKDIGRIELGKYSYLTTSTFNGRPASTICIYQAPGANAIEVAEKVNEKIEELRPTLAESGLEIATGYDSTEFIEASIDEVKETLYIAVLLVIAVVYIFLQDWRAALIPTMTIPVSLIGCFFLMLLFGFSMNTLTMFGLVLVIGIVVDDAIVVVENTQRILNSEQISPVEAAKKSMNQVSGPIVATTCVLCSVFIPTTFIGGMTGQLYTQFALTIAGAVVISALCALTISPALCAIFLRPESGKKKFIFFRLFNRCFDGFSSFYATNLKKLLRLPLIILFLWFGLVAALYWGMSVMPTGFIPNEDQGVLFVDVRLPDGASMERTKQVQKELQKIIDETPGKSDSIIIAGYSLLDGSAASNLMLGVIRLKTWNERSAQESATALQRQVMGRCYEEIPQAQIVVFSPPPISGIGTSGGLECELLDTRGSGNVALYESTQELISKAMETGTFSSLTSTFSPCVPQLYLNIDREKAKKMEIEFSELFSTLQTYLGATYVNDFNTFERIFRVVVQADGKNRQNIDQILDLPLMSKDGTNLPLRSIATIDLIVAPRSLNRFNLSSSTLITASLAPGQSSGTGMGQLENLGKELSEGFKVDWTGMSYQEKQVGSTVYIVFVLALIFGFLTLAAQYESWSAPIIIMMAVPLGVSGAILAVALRGLDINIYTQIGLILMVGLSAKNAILITEFARDNHLKEGMGIVESAMAAGTLRLRPIMMTSFAFILGVVPLAIASGAGANSRQAIGTAVCGGMLEETLIGILVTPVLFILLTRTAEACMKVFRRLLG
ncbi:MAG: multidrug efflux RND transporter permease subunit [Planctomycetia bacterium]|nr:multidrug efflux RND transporter permease subunit [Planctomycetia bacterium]